ncbi:MAG TPA: DNA polymerase III subunit delta [Gemmatimonadales bacterium]|jgi:DNA polymerase-3 subunit delta
MPAHSFDTLLRALQKGLIAPAYYLHGPEEILKDEAVRLILDGALDPTMRDFNFDQRSAAQLDPEAVSVLCTTLPMMTERRVVLLRDIEGWKRRPKTRAAVLDYLARPAPETLLILVQSSAEEGLDKELVGKTYSVACDPLPEERALKWLARRAGELGVRLEDGAARHLLQAVGNDLGAVAAELQKLAALPSAEPFTAAQVGGLVGVRHGETIYDWRDAVLDAQAAKAVSLLTPLLDQPGVTAVKLLTLLGTTLVGVGIARTHYDRRTRGPALEDLMFKTLLRLRIWGLPEYRKESARWAGWAASWSGARISAGLRAARDADQALKSTTVTGERGILAGLVFELTVPAAEAA